MKQLMLLAVLIMLMSCESRSRYPRVPQPLAPAEKVVIIETHYRESGADSYKVKRLSNHTVTFIDVTGLNRFEKGDTILWRFQP
jgi:hypothetical protein